MKKAILICALLIFMLPVITPIASAHPGRTDGNGGHTDHSTGEYHYHHGYPAHDHYDMDGDGDIDCPYDFADATATQSSQSTQSNSTEASGFDLLRCIELVMTTMLSVAIGSFILAQVIVFFSEDFSAVLFKIAFGVFFLVVPILFLYLIAIVINAIIG